MTFGRPGPKGNVALLHCSVSRAVGRCAHGILPAVFSRKRCVSWWITCAHRRRWCAWAPTCPCRASSRSSAPSVRSAQSMWCSSGTVWPVRSWSSPNPWASWGYRSCTPGTTSEVRPPWVFDAVPLMLCPCALTQSDADTRLQASPIWSKPEQEWVGNKIHRL